MNMNQVTIPATDMAASKAFYVTLGFELIVDTDHYVRFYCEDGGATFSLSLTDQRTPNPTVVYFEHEALDMLCNRLQQKGIEFEQLPHHQPYLWREAIVRDPAGNLIKLYWAGDNRVNPPWRVRRT
ncbi:VOC family protein [Aestuariibacter sp. AA17]|uniref:VOC family protein n=1 Tax=Fluctibacter corallii TaxID=2984329 RepID=A0ABT3A4P1_9ALTE|nr:VOC family protein [Aestuariibacter sp. AA17]MCV2883351.1 VOC family protein [Aestuariibacter sp. AA17]